MKPPPLTLAITDAPRALLDLAVVRMSAPLLRQMPRARGNRSVMVIPGFLGSDWVGPQVLAHHILLELTADLYSGEYHLHEDTFTLESRNCPSKTSLLYPQFFLGEQWRGQCINDKLQKSKIPLKECLHD